MAIYLTNANGDVWEHNEGDDLYMLDTQADILDWSDPGAFIRQYGVKVTPMIKIADCK